MKKIFLILSWVILASCAPSPTPAPSAPPPTAPSAAPTSVPAVTSAPAPTKAPTAVVGPTARPTNGPLFVPSPTPIALPSSAPKTPAQPTAAPTAGLEVETVTTAKQANGDITTSAALTQQDLGVGDIELSYPETMVVGESRGVHLRLSPSVQLVSSSKAAAKNPVPNTTFVYKFSGTVDLYPIMNAYINSNPDNFSINPSNIVQQPLDTSAPALWSWVIVAKQAGLQELSITISIPAVVNGTPLELGKTLQDLPLQINVKPKPVSLGDQISQSIANNSGAIIVALIGLFGTILGIVIKMRSDKDSKKK